MNLVVVICHFREDLGWVKELNHPYIIYNKNPKNNDKFEHNLPNVGFDTIVYLKYIIDNYDNLPNFVCFSQDNPFYHCPSFLKRVNDFNFEKEFIPLGITYFRDQDNIISKCIEFAKNHDIKLSKPIKFINSAQCIVSKNLILKNSKEYYEKIKESLPKNEIINETNYILEYLWPTIFGFNDDLNISFYNC